MYAHFETTELQFSDSQFPVVWGQGRPSCQKFEIDPVATNYLHVFGVDKLTGTGGCPWLHRYITTGCGKGLESK